jgi:hypothetical protein
MSAKRQAAAQYSKQSAGALNMQRAIADSMKKEQAEYQRKAEELLGQSPTYQTPRQVQQYQNMMTQSGGDLYAKLMGLAGNMPDYTGAGQAAIQNAANLQTTGAASLRDIVNKGVASSEAYAQQGMKQGLGDIKNFSDYYRTLASRQEMPGQRLMESKLGRSYAEGAKSIGQQAGGSISGLGAMIDLYSNKADSLSDIGIQAANYKSQQESALAGALERATSARQGIYSQMEQGALNRAAIGAEGEQAATGMATAGQQGLADYALNRQGVAQNQAATQGSLINQAATGQANLSGAGLLTGAQYADTAYQYNQLMPWQQSMNYYTNLISSLNPNAAMMGMTENYQNALNNLYSLFGKKAGGVSGL